MKIWIFSRYYGHLRTYGHANQLEIMSNAVIFMLLWGID